MKLPAVAIAVAFAASILLGVQVFDSRHAGAHRFLETSFAQTRKAPSK